MKLELIRKHFTDTTTIGELYINGGLEPECYTLEDKDREIDGVPVVKWKVPKVTAIPRGTYKITFYNSPKHGGLVPLLNDVPGYSYVEIHPGNYDKDTDGCILVGKTHAENFIGQSKDEFFNHLMPRLKAAKDDIYITIR